MTKIYFLLVFIFSRDKIINLGKTLLLTHYYYNTLILNETFVNIYDIKNVYSLASFIIVSNKDILPIEPCRRNNF